MNQQKNNNNKATICLYNPDRRIKPIQEWDGSYSFPKDGEGNYSGMTIYEISESLAASLCLGRPQWYKLISEKPLDAKMKNEWGGTTWIKVYPWRRDFKTVQKLDEDGKPLKDMHGNTSSEKVFVWTHIEPKITLPKVDEEK